MMMRGEGKVLTVEYLAQINWPGGSFDCEVSSVWCGYLFLYHLSGSRESSAERSFLRKRLNKGQEVTVSVLSD